MSAFRKMTLADFDYIESIEILNQVPSSRVLWADYERLCSGSKMNVSGLRQLTENDKHAIDRWLIASTGVMSKRQCDANPVNEKVRISSKKCIGYRPIRYGRAAIVETHGLLSRIWPLLDIKGCGVVDAALPEVSQHGTGVVGMGRAFRELFNSKTVETLLGQLCTTVRPVRILAILSLGVGVKLVDQEDTACIIVREPHLRPLNNREVPERKSRDMKVKIALEAMLMNFGLSSAWKFMEIKQDADGYTNSLDGGGRHPALGNAEMKALLNHLSNGKFYEFGLANIQLCRMTGLAPLSAEFVDLEHFFFRDRFSMDIWFPAYRQPLSWGYFCSANDARFIQPNRDLVSCAKPLLMALGCDRPVQEAGFEHGMRFERLLQRGALSDIRESCNALVCSIENSVTRKQFDDVVEIQGERVLPHRLDEWALRWSESIMRDPWPIFLQNEKVDRADLVHSPNRIC